MVTGTRAEFGLLRFVMRALQVEPDVDLQIVVTGMHLSPEFGLTYREIEEAGFTIRSKVEMLLDADTASAVTKSVGVGLICFSDAYAEIAPDLVLLLGDRFEIFSAAAAAMFARIPIAHIHGGETTEGAFDEAIRHSVTKMSHLHFVATTAYRNRVIQLGESPQRVFMVGGLGVDAICQADLLNREDLERSLNFKLGDRNLLVTFHPVTLESDQDSVDQMTELLAALGELEGTNLIFTMPNADTGGRELASMVSAFVAGREDARVFASLGQKRYLSCMKLMDAVVGNSSSGLTEAPSFGVPTVNIGDRQRGRLKASSVIDCAPRRSAILQAIETVYQPGFRKVSRTTINPYGDGGASGRIAKVLREYPLTGILKKSFYDLPVAT